MFFMHDGGEREEEGEGEGEGEGEDEGQRARCWIHELYGTV